MSTPNLQIRIRTCKYLQDKIRVARTALFGWSRSRFFGPVCLELVPEISKMGVRFKTQVHHLIFSLFKIENITLDPDKQLHYFKMKD